jgi:plastocyanin
MHGIDETTLTSRRTLLRGVLVGGAALLVAACGGGQSGASGSGGSAGSKPSGTQAPANSGGSSAASTPAAKASGTQAATTPAAKTSGTAATGGAAKSGAAAATVEMTDENKFVPETVTIKKGETIAWKNTGTMVHNVSTDATLAIDKSHAKLPSGAKAFSSPILTGGQTFSHTFDVAGDYVYFCQPHEAVGMVGKITVTE